MLAGLLIAAVVLSAPPVPVSHAIAEGALKSQVRDLVRQLRSDALDERDTAERKLKQFGPRILDFLPKPTDEMPADLRQRMTRVRQQLEQLRAEASTSGSTVTLDVDKQPLSTVLKTLAKLSGNRIVDLRRQSTPDAADPPVSLHAQGVPFWRALDMVLDQAGLTVDPFAADENSRPLRAVAVVAPLAPRSPRTAGAQYSGAFRFEPLTIIARRGLVDPAENGLQVMLEASWEPRLAPIALTFPRDSVSVILDGGVAARCAGAGTEPMRVQGGAVRFPIQLELPPRGARTIKRLSGQIKALLPGRVETFRFAELAEGAAKIRQRKASATLFIDRVHRNADAWEIALRIRFDDAGGALQSHLLGWLEENEVWLEGPDGKKIEVGTSEPTREDEAEYGITYFFPLQADIKGYTFVYRTPTALMEKTVAFELKNLELP